MSGPPTVIIVNLIVQPTLSRLGSLGGQERSCSRNVPLPGFPCCWTRGTWDPDSAAEVSSAISTRGAGRASAISPSVAVDVEKPRCELDEGESTYTGCVAGRVVQAIIGAITIAAGCPQCECGPGRTAASSMGKRGGSCVTTHVSTFNGCTCSPRGRNLLLDGQR